MHSLCALCVSAVNKNITAETQRAQRLKTKIGICWMDKKMTTKSLEPRILIAGLGNLLLMDDGVGVHAVQELQKDPPAGAVVAEVGTAVLNSLHLLEWADKILAIDAMQAGGEPGTVYAFGTEDVDKGGIKASLHELTLLSALGFLKTKAKPEIVIFGVEPERIDYGLDLTPAVAAALPELTAAAREQVRRWREK
jgi:hydrogenase maturation protease